MASRTHPIRNALEVCFLRAVQGLIRVLPQRWVTLPGAVLAWIAYLAVPRSRAAALRNLEIAFGDTLEPAQRRALLRRCYIHFGTMICEVLAMPRLAGGPLQAHVSLQDLDVLQAALAQQRGVILVSGHLGNWELMGGALSQGGHVLSMYVGAQRNPLVDEALNAVRRAMGTETVGKGVAMRGLLRALHDNRIVAMLADQHYSKKRHYVAFFGRPVSMVPGPASLSLRAGAPVVFGQCIRVGPFRYRANFHRVEPPPPTGNAEQDLLGLSQAISDALADAICEHPEQYFWMHRRFRPIPPGVVLSGINRAFLVGRIDQPLPDPAPGGAATLERAG